MSFNRLSVMEILKRADGYNLSEEDLAYLVTLIEKQDIYDRSNIIITMIELVLNMYRDGLVDEAQMLAIQIDRILAHFQKNEFYVDSLYGKRFDIVGSNIPDGQGLTQFVLKMKTAGFEPHDDIVKFFPKDLKAYLEL